jgi:hypothetical protein
MTVDPKIASHHMLGTDGLAPQPNGVRQYVRIIITPSWAESGATRHRWRAFGTHGNESC